MTAGALKGFGLIDFSCALKINTAANYTTPFLASLRENHCYIEDLHKPGSAEPWKYGV